MVFDPKLGYDPDEWEECSDPEHFLIFSTFTRIVLATAAVTFAYFFFKMVDDNKNKGKKKEVSWILEKRLIYADLLNHSND